MSHIANVKFTYRTPYGNTVNMFRKFRVNERDTNSILQWLRANIGGTDFEIRGVSWS